MKSASDHHCSVSPSNRGTLICDEEPFVNFSKKGPVAEVPFPPPYDIQDLRTSVACWYTVSTALGTVLDSVPIRLAVARFRKAQLWDIQTTSHLSTSGVSKHFLFGSQKLIIGAKDELRPVGVALVDQVQLLGPNLYPFHSPFPVHWSSYRSLKALVPWMHWVHRRSCLFRVPKAPPFSSCVPSALRRRCPAPIGFRVFSVAVPTVITPTLVQSRCSCVRWRVDVPAWGWQHGTHRDGRKGWV